MVGRFVEDDQLRRAGRHQRAGQRSAQPLAAAQGPRRLQRGDIAEHEPRQRGVGGVVVHRRIQTAEVLQQRLPVVQQRRALVQQRGRNAGRTTPSESAEDRRPRGGSTSSCRRRWGRSSATRSGPPGGARRREHRRSVRPRESRRARTPAPACRPAAPTAAGRSEPPHALDARLGVGQVGRLRRAAARRAGCRAPPLFSACPARAFSTILGTSPRSRGAATGGVVPRFALLGAWMPRSVRASACSARVQSRAAAAASSALRAA